MLIVFRYYYKFITNGQWRHSTASPTERDERANVNNVIVVGDIASVRPSIQQQKKVSAFCFVHGDISKSASSFVFLIRFSNILPSIHGFTIGST